MNQIFKSETSWWLLAPLLLLLLSIGDDARRHGQWATVLLLALPLAFIASLLLPTRYIITEAELAIACGPLTWRVPVPQINRLTHNPLSSPAPSLKRLEIRYGKYDFVRLWPADQAGFLAALHRLNPAIRHD
ncbi:hypothetical protein HNQ93_003778 [Hymenobacter luteus]|uniref:Uncharacterized protein YyaB-like PH domain-containing protein n=2 Tax=Hymenobacter TaxID=89966 RepID=A0A7W9T3H1_9BACT|nr:MULTISPECIES: PH domain-containing protein [Hymenobacter]MBB4603139.1 hypothetical protein [Hymenobacter latericoloratus]MBB6060902.1 hypothetical protein [Hymenobacter luteus]